MKVSKTEILLIVLAIVSIGGYIVYATRPVETKPVAQVSEYDVGAPDATEILELVNQERAKYNVAPLVLDDRLNKSAATKATDMYENQYYEHVNPLTGKQGYTYIFDQAPELCTHASENLLDFREGATSRDMFNSWMRSKPHREAMLDARYDLIGEAYINGFGVQHFCDVK